MSTFWRYALIVLLILASGKRCTSTEFREGEPKFIDVENNDDFATVGTSDEITNDIKRKCPSDKPGDIILKSKSGIKDQYVVVLCNTDEDNEFAKMLESIEVTNLGKTTVGTMSMYHIICKDRDTLKKVARYRTVAEVEQNHFIKLSGYTHRRKKKLPKCFRQKIDDSFLWGLDRLGHRGGGKDRFDKLYKYNVTNQEYIDVYLIDTGIVQLKEEFGDRVQKGVVCHSEACVSNKDDPTRDANVDLNGHGTHVAGTVGGKTYGVAKGVNLIPVKLEDIERDEKKARFTLMTVINAFKWVKEQVIKKKKQNLSIMNLSIGGPFSICENRMVEAVIQAGVSVVVAAGNEQADACKLSPSSVKDAIVVGCMTKSDTICFFSNHGECVDILAPGFGIRSANTTGGSRILSGTSQSAPHVTGAAAIILSHQFPDGLRPVKLWKRMRRMSSKGVIEKTPKNTIHRIPWIRCFPKKFNLGSKPKIIESKPKIIKY